MNITFEPAHVFVSVFTEETPYGETFKVSVPEDTKVVAVDKDGKINAFKTTNVFPNGDAWDTTNGWTEVADLGFEVEQWEEIRLDIAELDSESRCGGSFGVCKV